MNDFQIKIHPFLPVPYLVPACDVSTKWEIMVEVKEEEIHCYVDAANEIIYVSKERFESMRVSFNKIKEWI